MKNMRNTLFGLSLFVAASVPLSARADNCIARYSSAFASLEGKAWQAGTQAGADAAVEELFGPRPQTCEDGAYDYFLNRFEEFASSAVRKGSPKKPAAERNENLLRLAISAVRKGPIQRSAKDAKSSQFSMRQVRAHVDPRVEEYGNTPLMQSLLGAIGNALDPQVIAEAPPPSSASGNVLQIKVPLQPMPSWGIVHLYEMRDIAKNTGADPALQSKLQAIINWVEQTTQTSP